jgi:hypothetical protein
VDPVETHYFSENLVVPGPLDLQGTLTTRPQTRPRKGYQSTNSVALVRERNIPTERPPVVGEVSANFCG